jgi:D-arabinose 1-dehydrogenase-like Zn-dependent alcohol dehydrogenase
MRPTIEFSAKHNIKPPLSTYRLEEVPKMVEMMNAHKAQGRMGVVFD